MFCKDDGSGGDLSKAKGERNTENLKGFVVHFPAKTCVKAASHSLPRSTSHFELPTAYWIITGTQPSSLPYFVTLWRSRIQSGVIVRSNPQLHITLICSHWNNLDFPNTLRRDRCPEWPHDLHAANPLRDNLRALLSKPGPVPCVMNDLSTQHIPQDGKLFLH